MTDRTAARKSFVGGLLGGAIGYGVGALVGSQWLAFILFFVVAYLGYDVRQVIAAMPGAAKGSVEALHKSTSNAWGWIGRWHGAPALTLWIIPAVVILVNAGGNEVSLFGSENPFYEQVWLCFSANWEWLQTGINPLAPELNNDVPAAARSMTYWSNILLGLLGGSGVWIVIGCSASILIAIVENLRKVPIALMWGMFFVTVGPVLVLAKFVTLILMVIHDFRRVACGLVTLVAGGLYMLIVPFGSFFLPVGVAAIGCGLCAGAAAGAASVFIEADGRYDSIIRFWDRPIPSFAPAFMQQRQG